MAPSNFLLLDEPTNHLDMRAKDVLLNALASYSGTIVFVSHDRYFIDKLATRIFEVSDGKVEAFLGNYEDYIRQKDGLLQVAESQEPAEKEVRKTAPSKQPPAKKAKRINPIRLRQMRERYEVIEEEVARADAAIAECEQELAVYKGAEQAKRLTQLMEQRQAELDALMAEWEELVTALG